MHEHDDYDASSGNGDYVEVSSEGESYHLDAEYDVDHDGVDDSAVVGHADGSSTTYTDTDHDGDADFKVTVNADGQVIDQQRHDESSDTWVGMSEDAHADTASEDANPAVADTAVDDLSHADGENITVDTGRGEVDAGEARYDFDQDGVNDTAVVSNADGDQMFLTDTDGDGDADVATEVDADGNVVVYTESGDDGDWEVAEAGHVDDKGDLQIDYRR